MTDGTYRPVTVVDVTDDALSPAEEAIATDALSPAEEALATDALFSAEEAT
jgi:hypothetical protein